MYTKEELKSIADVIYPHPQIFILSDEIYEHIRFEMEHESIAQFDFIKDRVIVVNGVAKGYAMTGWRIGYIGAPLAIAKACDKMQGQFTSGACSIAQKAALEAVSSDWSMYNFMQESFQQRRDLTISLIKDIPGLKYNIPQGAFYVFPDVTYYFGKKFEDSVINNATDLCIYLLKEAKVSIVTGEAFGDNRCVRLSYATSEALLTEAMKRIKEALAKLK
jgi:aspartate aminotransferase